MKRSRLLILILAFVTALSLSLTACGEPLVPEVLDTPSVTVNTEGEASWQAISGATGYAYKIGSGSEQTTSATSVQLEDGDTITVKALGDGTEYLDSEYSEPKTYTAPITPPKPEVLAAPTVSINEDGEATWQAVENATKYVYKINGGAEQVITGRSVLLTDGETITVKAKGDGLYYLDSEYSEPKTYTAPIIPPEPEVLTAPTVSVNEDGIASWQAIANASGYVYKINGGSEQATSATSIRLDDGDTITVKAVGDGTEYLDSAYSQTVTYTAPIEPQTLAAPTVSVNEDGIASWQAIANASGYVYKINGGSEQATSATSVQLEDGDTITVKAKGDGVYYTDSAYSASVTYTAPTVKGAIPDFDVNSIPKYTAGGEGYYVVNGGIPFFAKNEITDEAYELYGELDALGRCTVAMGCLDFSLMPTVGRKDPTYNPTGWQSGIMVNGLTLYNRAHLIGWQLADEVNNEKNLITGTQFMNQMVMTVFENRVADYIKETNENGVSNHVMYRVTPIFEGNNLLCTGVLMEAWSVEDNGEELHFNVFCYNVQEGVTINYATGEAKVEAQQPPMPADATYIINTKNKKIHSITSKYANNLTSNMEYTNKTLQELLSMGYSTCGTCKPS